MYLTTTTESNSRMTERVRMTAEEWVDYQNKRFPNRPTCVLCNEKCECPWGNNPYPLATRGVCCGKCNTKVIMARLAGVQNNEPYGDGNEEDEEEEEPTCERCGDALTGGYKYDDDTGFYECDECCPETEDEDYDDETCDKCGKSERECDQFPRGDNITNFAETGEMLCPDCIPETKLEREEVSDDSDKVLEIMEKVKNGTWKPKWNCENGECPNEFNLKDDDRYGEETLWCPECVSKFGEPEF